MQSITRYVITASALTLAGLLAAPYTAQAAETFNTCTGFIDSVPATITKQGVWCLRKDLSTANTSGNAITIAANNVTIDCNNFKIGGLGAGNGSSANGIYSADRYNATIRNCNIRGFRFGIRLDAGAGHLVEDNRLDHNLLAGIGIYGDNSSVRRNRVYDTGGSTVPIDGGQAYGIIGTTDITDNTVSGLVCANWSCTPIGIHLAGEGSVVRGNQVLGFDSIALDGGSIAEPVGIYMADPGQHASGNHITLTGAVLGWGIYPIRDPSFCLNNSVSGFQSNIPNNCISTGNLTSP